MKCGRTQRKHYSIHLLFMALSLSYPSGYHSPLLAEAFSTSVLHCGWQQQHHQRDIFHLSSARGATTSGRQQPTANWKNDTFKVAGRESASPTTNPNPETSAVSSDRNSRNKDSNKSASIQAQLEQIRSQLPQQNLTQEVCDQLLAYCVSNDEWDAVLDVLDVMKASGLSQVESTYTTCLEACLGTQNSGSALEILQAMQQAGFVPTKQDYALVVQTLCPDSSGNNFRNQRRPYPSKKEWQEAVTFVRQQPDLPIEIVDRVLNCLSRVKQWKESILLLQFLEANVASLAKSPQQDHSATEPALSTYTAVIECCLAANQPEQALKVLQASLRRQFVPTVNTFESMVLAFSQKLRWRRALQVVQLMDEHKVPKTLHLCNALLTSCAKAKEVVQAKNLLVQMRQKHGIVPNIRSYNAVLAACASTSRWRDALDVLDQCYREPGVEPDICTYTNVIRACAKGGKTQRALTLFQVVKDKGVPIDTYCYTAAIEACAKARMSDRALALLDEMEEQGIEPSEVTYSVAITACCNRKALDLLETMRRKNMPINLIVYNAAITALSKAAKQSLKQNSRTFTVGDENQVPLWEEAMALLEQMNADGIEPDGFSFCSAISCCGAEGRWKEALQLIDAMQNGGPRTQPNKIAYTAAIASCGRSGEVDHALRLFRQMKEQGLSPDRVAYNALFSALRVAKRADIAAELWDEMLGTKQSNITKTTVARPATTPDIITVTDAIGAMSCDDSKKSMERIDRIFAEAVQRRIVLRPGTLDSAHEVDLSGMALPVARAACRYILRQITMREERKIRELTFITGVGIGKAAGRVLGAGNLGVQSGDDVKGLTSLREYVQEILLAEFSPPLASSVPQRAQGTVVIERAALLQWKRQNQN